MKTRKIICGAFALLAFAACSKNSGTKTEETPQAYPTMVVSKQTAILESVFPATIKGMEDVDIKPRMEGFIEAIYVDEGSKVRTGQALFKINSPQTEQVLSSAQASVQSAQAQVNTAKVNVDRIRPLADKGIISGTQLLTYENSYETAKATLMQAEAALKNAQVTMSWTTVTSPVDGVVGTLSYRLGSLVNSANTLTTVASTENVFAYFSLNEYDLRAFLDKAKGNTQAEKIKKLPLVTLQFSDGSIYPQKGKIETISGVVNVSTGSANFRAEFPNNEGLLRSGYSANVILPEAIEEAIIIPQKATFAQQDKILLYRVQGDQVEQILVTVKDMPDGKSYVVTSGLSDGDRIVSDGIATLSSGKKITVNDNGNVAHSTNN